MKDLYPTEIILYIRCIYQYNIDVIEHILHVDEKFHVRDEKHTQKYGYGYDTENPIRISSEKYLIVRIYYIVQTKLLI